MSYFDWSGKNKNQKSYMETDDSRWGFNYAGMHLVPKMHSAQNVLDIAQKKTGRNVAQKKMNDEAEKADSQIAINSVLNSGLMKLSSEEKNEIREQKNMDAKAVNFGYDQNGLFSAGLRRRDYENSSKSSSVKT